MRGLTRALEQLYCGGQVRTAFLVAPKWIAVRLAPGMGVGSDFVEASWGAPPQFNTNKAVEELGLRPWVPLETSLYDMVENLAAKGLIQHPLVAARGTGTAVAAAWRWQLVQALIVIGAMVAVLLLILSWVLVTA